MSYNLKWHSEFLFPRFSMTRWEPVFSEVTYNKRRADLFSFRNLPLFPLLLSLFVKLSEVYIALVSSSLMFCYGNEFHKLHYFYISV